MSTNKHIDIICIAVISVIFIITLLFLLCEKFDIPAFYQKQDSNNIIRFTDNDLNDNWDTSNATKIELNEDGAQIKGNGAYFKDNTLYLVYAGKYVISGTFSGSIHIDADGDDKIWILFDGLNITSKTDPPLFIKQADKVFLTLKENSQNRLVFENDNEESEIDGCIFSRDDLTINGEGFLTIKSENFHGIVCNDSFVMTGGNINITAKKDAVHAHDAIYICNTILTASAGDDGLHTGNDDETAVFYLESGNINITECYEGIEANDITIAGGTVNITSKDDGINANGKGQSSTITISGGNISIINNNGRDADGLDSNGSINITGGNVFISVPGNGSNCAIDYGSENNGKFIISGGTVIACGSSQMVESPDSSSTQGFITEALLGNAGDTVSILDINRKVILEKDIPNAFSFVIISSPDIKLGDTIILKTEDSEKEIIVSNISGNEIGNFRIKGNFNPQKGQNWDNENPFDKETGNIPPEIPNENHQEKIPMMDRNGQGGPNEKNSFQPPVNDNQQKTDLNNRQEPFQNERIDNADNLIGNFYDINTDNSKSNWFLLGISLIILTGGLIIAIKK